MNAMEDKIDKKKITTSVVTGLALAMFGLVFFTMQNDYKEAGHNTLLMIYVAIAILIIIPIYFAKKILTILLGAVMILAIAYSWAKFDWRNNYVKNTIPFALEEYIDSYPTFEDHYFPLINDNPRWVHFANDCYIPATLNNPMGDNCRSIARIKDAYNIDLNEINRRHYNKMRRTAQMLEEGQLMNKEQYRRCLAAKRCAIIPLLPVEAKDKVIQETSQDYINIRRQFWSLINDEGLSPEICEFIDLCRVMRDQNIIAIEKPTKQ